MLGVVMEVDITNIYIIPIIYIYMCIFKSNI